MFLKPIITSIAVTNKCNLKCVHCLPDSKMSCENELSFEEIKNIIKQAKELGAMVIAYTGGEVFVRPDIFDIFKETINNGLRFSITTNGTLINEEIAHKLSLLKPLVVRISIDSSKEEEHDYFRGKAGAYRDSINGIKLLIKNNIPVTAITTITTKNKDEVEEIIKSLIPLGVNAFNTTSFVPFGRGAEHQDLMLTPEQYKDVLTNLKALKEKYKGIIDVHWHDTLSFLLEERIEKNMITRACPAGWSMMEINAEGYVMPCISMGIQEENIREKTLSDIWFNSGLFNTIRDIELSGKCKSCDYAKKCLGGCRAIAYNYYHDLNAPDPMCWAKTD